MQQELGNEAEQEVLEETHGELEVGPVMTVLKALQSVALEVNLAVEELLVENLHGDLALATVGGTVMLAVEVQVVLDGAATVLGLLGLAGGDARGDSPEGHQNGDGSEDSEEDGGVEATADLASQVPGHDGQQEEHQAIGEAVATRGVRGDGGILDGRVLATKRHEKLTESELAAELLTRVVGTPQSKAGLDC